MNEATKTVDQSEPIIKRFRELPLGTRFKYLEGNQVWVILERYGDGKVAAWDGIDNGGRRLAFQSLCSAAESNSDCEDLTVVVVG